MRALAFLCVLFLSACASNQTPYVLSTRWKDAPQPAEMDYANPAAWSALPSRFDAADLVPRKSSLKDEQANAKADVFLGDGDGVPSQATPTALFDAGTGVFEFELRLVFLLLKLHECTYMA